MKSRMYKWAALLKGRPLFFCFVPQNKKSIVSSLSMFLRVFHCQCSDIVL